MTIRKFRHLYQVRNNGYTVSQFSSKEQAIEFIKVNATTPSVMAYMDSSNAISRTAHRIRRISIYP